MEKLYITLLPIYFQGRKLVDKGKIGGLIGNTFRFHSNGNWYVGIPAGLVQSASNSQLFSPIFGENRGSIIGASGIP